MQSLQKRFSLPISGLYQCCVTYLQVYSQLMSDDRWTLEQQAVVQNCRSQLILWGEDLCYGQIEAYLAHSMSLKRSVIEVLTSLGAVIALVPLHKIIDRVERFRLGREDSLHKVLYQANRILNHLDEMNSDDDDTASISFDSESEDVSDLSSRENWVQDLERYTRLLFQLAPALHAISDEIPMSEPSYYTIEISPLALRAAAARNFMDRFRRGREPQRLLPRLDAGTERGSPEVDSSLAVSAFFSEMEKGVALREGSKKQAYISPGKDSKTSTPPPGLSDPSERMHTYLSDYAEPERPSWIRVSTKHVLPETLDYFALSWDCDPEDDEYLVIKEPVSHEAMRKIFDHTKETRKSHERAKVPSSQKSLRDLFATPPGKLRNEKDKSPRRERP